jgi:HSP20 family protein
MSAQQSNKTSTTQNVSTGEERQQQTSLARQNAVPPISSLLLDPFGFFDDGPFSLLGRLQNELIRASSRGASRNRSGQDDITNIVWVPPVEVDYRDGKFMVSAELPGLKDEDVRVEVRDDAIVIQGERQEQREENDRGVRRTELRYGQFYRAIPLPDGADTENARAEFRNGVLQVTVPVAEQKSNVRQIPVQSTGSSQSTQLTSRETGERKGTETPASQKAA